MIRLYSNREQLSFLIQYMSNEEAGESFIEFSELNEGTTGKAIASTIERAIEDYELDPNQMVGQVYV